MSAVSGSAWQAVAEIRGYILGVECDMDSLTLDEEKALAALGLLQQLADEVAGLPCVGDHYCPNNPNFLGDVWSDDPALWPRCAVCELKATRLAACRAGADGTAA